eukprot:7748831-Alexandrium_andersonii.AAC.1
MQMRIHWYFVGATRDATDTSPKPRRNPRSEHMRVGSRHSQMHASVRAEKHLAPVKLVALALRYLLRPGGSDLAWPGAMMEVMLQTDG